MQREILLELHTPDRLRDNLDIVNIVLGFLSSGGAKAETAFGEYVDKVLQLERRSFSPKVICVARVLVYFNDIIGSRVLLSWSHYLLMESAFCGTV